MWENIVRLRALANLGKIAALLGETQRPLRNFTANTDMCTSPDRFNSKKYRTCFCFGESTYSRQPEHTTALWSSVGFILQMLRPWNVLLSWFSGLHLNGFFLRFSCERQLTFFYFWAHLFHVYYLPSQKFWLGSCEGSFRSPFASWFLPLGYWVGQSDEENTPLRDRDHLSSDPHEFLGFLN